MEIRKLKIALLEDEMVMRARWTMSCELGGHEVQEFEGCANALRALSEGKFDLILCDFNVVGGDTLEFIRTARAMMPHAFLLAVSGEYDNRLLQIKAGCDDEVAKPLAGSYLEKLLPELALRNAA